MGFFSRTNHLTHVVSFLLVASIVVLPWLFLGVATIEASEVAKQIGGGPPESARASFDDALNNERSDLSEMEQQLKRWEALKESTNNEIEAARIQNTAHENLLLVLHVRIEMLETALNKNRLALKSLSDRITDFERIGAIAPTWMAQLVDRISIAEKRMTEVRRDRTAGSGNQEIRVKLQGLLDLLYEKKKQGEQFTETYNRLFERLKRTRADLTETRRQLEERLQSLEKSKLFERHLQPFGNLRIGDVVAVMQAPWKQMDKFLAADYWDQQWVNIQRSGGITQAIFLALFLLAVIARKRILKLFRATEAQIEGSTPSKRWLALVMLRRSFLLIVAAMLLSLYDLLKLPYIHYRLASFLNHVVFTLMLTRWGIDFLQHRPSGTDSALAGEIKHRLVHFFQAMRWLIIIFLGLTILYGSESVLTWMFRFGIEAALFVWAMIFWRATDSQVDTEIHQGGAARRPRLHVARAWSYLVFGGALLIDLLGYHVLAGHWLVSWVGTLALGLWAYLAWGSIGEWHASQQSTAKTRADGSAPIVAAPVGWLLVQMARLLWLSAVLAGALMAWAGSDMTAKALQELFALDVSVGSLKFSIKGMLLAVIVFYVTHVATRIGRRLLSEKILDSRNFERGLKDSIVTISSYLIWSVGILLALGLLGVNTTSLAVVFGALSIGIGFGLQNIFNNFISGLILLFERPIQVGDYVEVNGLWAEVKKINVRSTIVQTFDNATVIIPNSDFISQQVTNWSFKDPRMRRHVDVGVAYGSDIELVRSTLLDIPGHMPQILTHPQPDVLFLDHGDSALIFRLRYWTHVDNYYSTSTAVRFELDHRFRELGIEIAFPQRDLHIRSGLACPLDKAETAETVSASTPRDHD